MKPDIEIFVDLLTRNNIGYSEYLSSDGSVINLEQGSNNVQGYMGFSADFHFSPNGKLEQVGIWE